VLTVPDTKGRYYLLALLDAYTNVAASIGKRTTGTEKRQFAIVGPHFKGRFPRARPRSSRRPNLAWIFGRTAVEDKADLANAPRSRTSTSSPDPRRGKGPRRPRAPPRRLGARRDAEGKSPRDQVAAMNAATFFARVAMLLPEQSAVQGRRADPREDEAIGLEPGKPFDARSSTRPWRKALDEGVQTAIQAVSPPRAACAARTSATAGASIARSGAGATITAPRRRGVERHRRQRAGRRHLHEHRPGRRQEARRRQSLRPSLRPSSSADRRLLVDLAVRRQAALRRQSAQSLQHRQHRPPQDQSRTARSTS
jgi:hypothetical protein